MTYREVNEVFEGKDVKGYEPFKDSLEKMLELSHLLRKQRQNRGAISFEIPKPKYILDEDGRAIDVTVTERKEGEKLIKEIDRKITKLNEIKEKDYEKNQDEFIKYVYDKTREGEHETNEFEKMLNNMNERLGINRGTVEENNTHKTTK